MSFHSMSITEVSISRNLIVRSPWKKGGLCRGPRSCLFKRIWTEWSHCVSFHFSFHSFFYRSTFEMKRYYLKCSCVNATLELSIFRKKTIWNRTIASPCEYLKPGISIWYSNVCQTIMDQFGWNVSTFCCSKRNWDVEINFTKVGHIN